MSNKPWIYAGAALTVLALCLAGAGVMMRMAQPWSRPDFERTFLGATQGEVRARLGAPDEVSSVAPPGVTEDFGRHNADIQAAAAGGAPGGDPAWLYRGRTRDGQGPPDSWVLLTFRHGRVAWIDFGGPR